MNRKSVHEILSTPSACRKKLNTTYVKCQVRGIFPEYVDSSQNEMFVKRSNELKEIGLPETIWETYQVNALYDFSYQKPQLKGYEKTLKSVIKNDISKIESDSNSQYKPHDFKVKIESFPDMAYTENDFPPLKITVIPKQDEVPWFTGFLISVGRKSGFMEEERKQAEAIILPLFLVDYLDKIFFESVKWFLENNFSCLVSPLTFSTRDMMWMLALFCPKNDQCTGVTVIDYKVPLKELSSIDYAVDPYTIAEVWNRVTEPNSKEISEDQVYEFFSILEHHFYNMFSINLSEFELHAIKTPLARIQANHSIIPYHTSKLYFVMRHLTHLAQEIIK